MARYSAAYLKFIERLNEIEMLGRIARRNDLGCSAKNILAANALCRSAIVLLTSHIEGYVEDLCEIALEKIVIKEMKKCELGESFQYYCSKDIIKSIQSSDQAVKITGHIKELFKRDDDIWSNNDLFLTPLPYERFIIDFSNPKPEFIKKLMNRFGYLTYEGDLKSILKGDYIICSNMIDQVVENRHKIAHGDPLVTSTPSGLQEMIRLVKIYCRTTDEVTAKWFADKGCPIRS